jgi:hypothetical protein
MHRRSSSFTANNAYAGGGIGGGVNSSVEVSRTLYCLDSTGGEAIESKGVSTPPATCPLPRGGRVNDCSWLKRIDKRVRKDRDARVATQLQPNHESFEFWPL